MLVRISVASDLVGDIDIAEHVESPTLRGGRSDVVASRNIEKGLLAQTLIKLANEILDDPAC